MDNAFDQNKRQLELWREVSMNLGSWFCEGPTHQSHRRRAHFLACFWTTSMSSFCMSAMVVCMAFCASARACFAAATVDSPTLPVTCRGRGQGGGMGHQPSTPPLCLRCCRGSGKATGTVDSPHGKPHGHHKATALPFLSANTRKAQRKVDNGGGTHYLIVPCPSL